jgi:hypothetical protein
MLVPSCFSLSFLDTMSWKACLSIWVKIRLSSFSVDYVCVCVCVCFVIIMESRLVQRMCVEYLSQKGICSHFTNVLVVDSAQLLVPPLAASFISGYLLGWDHLRGFSLSTLALAFCTILNFTSYLTLGPSTALTCPRFLHCLCWEELGLSTHFFHSSHEGIV